MSIPLVINGATFEYPQDFDENWGVNATGWAQAVTNGMLQMAGGSFPITADINFGPNFGLLSKYFETRSALPATIGTVRLSSADAGIAFRNHANTGNLIITTDTSDNLLYNGSTISGGVNPGTQYALGYYATTGSNLSPNPNTMAATQALVTDANGVPTTTGNGGTTATEIGFVHGATSSIQTQINAKVASVSGTINQITSTGGTTPVLAIANPLTLPGAMTAGGAIAMASNKVTGLADGTTAGDALSYGQVFPGKNLGITEIYFTGSDVTTSSATYADTGLTSGSFTPVSSTSNIKITCIQSIRCDNTNVNANVQADIKLLKDASILRTWTQAALIIANPQGATSASFYNFVCTFTYLDTSHSGAARTYKTQVSDTNANGQIRINNSTFGSIMYIEEIGQ